MPFSRGFGLAGVASRPARTCTQCGSMTVSAAGSKPARINSSYIAAQQPQHRHERLKTPKPQLSKWQTLKAHAVYSLCFSQNGSADGLKKRFCLGFENPSGRCCQLVGIQSDTHTDHLRVWHQNIMIKQSFSPHNVIIMTSWPDRKCAENLDSGAEEKRFAFRLYQRITVTI